MIALMCVIGALASWDHLAQAKEQKLCYDCQRDGGCVPGPDCCAEIRCSNGPWYCCLGGGWK